MRLNVGHIMSTHYPEIQNGWLMSLGNTTGTNRRRVMKCGEWSLCDLQFCPYYKEGEECVKASKYKRPPTESKVNKDGNDEVCRRDEHD